MYFYYFHRTPYPIPQHHSWVKGGTAYSDAEDYGHAIPSRVVRPVAELAELKGFLPSVNWTSKDTDDK